MERPATPPNEAIEEEKVAELFDSALKDYKPLGKISFHQGTIRGGPLGSSDSRYDDFKGVVLDEVVALQNASTGACDLLLQAAYDVGEIAPSPDRFPIALMAAGAYAGSRVRRGQFELFKLTPDQSGELLSEYGGAAELSASSKGRPKREGEYKSNFLNKHYPLQKIFNFGSEKLGRFLDRYKELTSSL